MKHFEIWHYSSVDLNAAGGIEKFILGLSQAFSAQNIPSYTGLHFNKVSSESKSKCLIIHTHGDCWPNFDFQKQLKELKKHYNQVKWIHISHGNTIARMIACGEYLSYSGYKGALRDLSLIQLSDAIIAVSQHAKNENSKYFLTNKRTHVIYNGVNSSLFKPLNQISNNLSFIFVGRDKDRVKNTKLILNAFRSLSSTNKKVQLYMAPGIESQTLDNVVSLGLLTPEKLQEQMTKTNAIILSSFYEGDALVLREAMAMGLPIIASQIEANLETCSNYQNIYWINPNDDQSVIQVIQNQFINKTHVPKPLIRDWTTVSKEYLEFYSKLVSIN